MRLRPATGARAKPRGERPKPGTPVSLAGKLPQMRTFWRIIKLLGGYKWLTVAGFTFAFVQMGLSLVVPRITQLTIDKALIGGEYGCS